MIDIIRNNYNRKIFIMKKNSRLIYFALNLLCLILCITCFMSYIFILHNVFFLIIGWIFIIAQFFFLYKQESLKKGIKL